MAREVGSRRVKWRFDSVALDGHGRAHEEMTHAAHTEEGGSQNSGGEEVAHRADGAVRARHSCCNRGKDWFASLECSWCAEFTRPASSDWQQSLSAVVSAVV